MTEVGSAYDSRADEYIDLFGSVDQLADRDRATITTWRDSTSGPLLDAGCGPGHWTAELAMDGVRAAVGLDASAEFVAAARRRFPQVGFSQADLAAIPLDDGSLGGILAWYSIIHTPPSDLPAILAELARVLAPGGSALIGFFDGAPGEAFDHAVHTAYYWSAQSLGDILAQEGLITTHSATRQDPGARRIHGELIATLS